MTAALGRSHPSLARGVPDAAAGTVFALTLDGGVSMPPREGRELVFGRNRDDVHVCLGENDRRVSRHQGTLVHDGGVWWVRGAGRLPIRLPGGRLVYADSEPAPLPAGYTAAFVRGTGDREHLLEIYVVGAGAVTPAPRPADVTEPPRTWPLTPDERIALVALAQRFLRQEATPQPLAWRHAAEQLQDVEPDGGWTAKRVEHLVSGVRVRLARSGVPGLTREEVGEPVGNALNTNLIDELVHSTTLVPPDLALLDPPG